jgi:hypothetical protein
MRFRFFEKTTPRPDQLNELGQVTDRVVLNRDRLKLGVSLLVTNGQEYAFGPVHTVVVRALGGTEFHLGLVSAVYYASYIFLWLGPLLLRLLRSNVRAMKTVLICGLISVSLLMLVVLSAAIWPAYKGIVLIVYLMLVFSTSGISGVQTVVEASWIGDLVPLSLRGWFTSVKWMVFAVGMLGLIVLFGQISARCPTLPAYAGMFGIIAISHVVALIVVSSVTDRPPQTANLISTRHHEDRIDYKNAALWKYVWFFVSWAGGRTALTAFSTAYMLDHFHYSMDKILAVFAITNLINIVMLPIMGKVSDHIGTRLPLTFISGLAGLAMTLWVSSAWWGIAPIIVYQFINGAASTTHMMLATNYGLEILPAKGRCGYISFTQLLVGLSAALASVMAGIVMHAIKGWTFVLWGAEISHYHLFFLGCALLTMSCVLPLVLPMKNKGTNQSNTDQ